MHEPSESHLMFKSAWANLYKDGFAHKDKYIKNIYESYWNSNEEFLPLKYSRKIRYDLKRGWIPTGGERKNTLASFFRKIINTLT